MQLYLHIWTHHHHHFISMSMLAWVGWVSLMPFLQASQFCVNPECNLNFLKSSLINWFDLLHSLPFPLWLPTSVNLQLLTGFSLFLFLTWLKHLSLVWRKNIVTLEIPSLFFNSLDDFQFLWLTWQIHHTICMSVQTILLISLSFSGQVLLPYSMRLQTQAEYYFPFILCESTWDARRGKGYLNFF